MLLGEILRVALQSIRANIIRSCLTMLGIIIGVAAVITMLAAGSGAQQQIEEQIDALGANVLNITAETWFLRGVARDALTLEVEDVWALREHAQHLDAVVPTLEDRGQITYDGPQYKYPAGRHHGRLRRHLQLRRAVRAHVYRSRRSGTPARRRGRSIDSAIPGYR